MRKIWRRFHAGVLAGILFVSLPFSTLTGPEEVHAGNLADDEWSILREKLSSYGGTWETPDYENAVSDNMPQTALQGNGDTAIVSYGNAGEKTYLISKGDFRNGGDLITSAPFHEDDRSIRQIALGGVTIKKDRGENKSLTMDPDVTVQASSVHDAFEPGLAVNGNISAQEEAWASKAGEEPHWFEIDLGSDKTIAKYVMYHMGYAREDLSHFNTKEYKVSVRAEDGEWTEADHVLDNAEDMTSCIFSEPVCARFVRIDFIQGEQSSNERARIAEFELFADASDESIFAGKEENKSLTQRPGVTIEASSVHDEFFPENAVNGMISEEEEGWVSALGGDEQWIKIDLGDEQIFQKYIMHHIGMSRKDLSHFNTRAYTVSVSSDDVTYENIDVVSDNSKDYTKKVFDAPVQARYIMISFQDAQQTDEFSEQRARIAEFELFESPDEESTLVSEDFWEHQDIVNADLTTNMLIDGTAVEMNNWLSATENTMVTSISSNGERPVALNAEAWTKDDGSPNFPTQSDVAANSDGVWASRSTYNAAKENPESWTSKAVIYSKLLGDKEFSAEKNSEAGSSLKFVLEPGETVYLVTTIGGGGQTYDCNDNLQTEEPLDQAEALAEQYFTESDIEILREQHEQWWEDYWTRSYIDIGDEDFHRYYFGSLYYMGCAAREDKVAPGLYGHWVTGDAAKYNNDYHLNYNFMAPYYGMYSSNRFDGAYSLLQPILDYMPKAENAAKNQLGDINWNYSSERPELADGIEGGVLYPVGLTAWGHASWEADNASKYISQTLNAPFAASVFISCYNYSSDEEFLVNTAYPFVEKVAKFYEKWCEKEEKTDGTYQYNLYDGPHEGFFDKNSGVTIGMVLNVYEFLIQNYDILNEKAGATDEQLAMWKDMYEHMAPIPVRSYENGDFKKDVFALAEEGMILRPESASVELEFIHPGERLSFDSDPDMLQIARNTVEAKEAANEEVWGNINNNSKMFTQAIRVGYDPSYIMEKFREYNILNMNENFTIRDGHHGIEKAGGIEFINNMLLQSSEGIIKVFPNWTGSDARFHQLREKGACLVSSELSQGEVKYIEVISEAGKEVTLVSPWENASVSDSEGNVIACSKGMTKNTNEKTITFMPVQGDKYQVTEGSDEQEKIDLTSLKLAIVMAEKMEAEQGDNKCYTEESWTAAAEALNAARALLERSGITQPEADEAFLNLISACSLVENGTQKVGLKAAIEGTESILSDKGALEQYQQESVEAVKSALLAARQVYDDQKASQAAVNEAASYLLSAVTSMLVKDDHTRLGLLIQKAEEILNREEQYTTSSIERLKSALEAAETTAKNSDATEKQINEAYTKLTIAMTSLVRKANKDELKNALEQADKILGESGKYLESSIAGLQAAADGARLVYEKEEADSSAVGEVLKMLIREILKARLMGDVDLNGAVDTQDAAILMRADAELEVLEEEQNLLADVNGDGVPDSSDAVVILQYAAEMLPDLS